MKITVALAVCALIVGAALALSGAALYVRFQQGAATRQAILERDRNQNAALRKFLCYFERQVLKTPGLSESKREQTIVFFEGALRQIGAAPCKVGSAPRS